MIYYSQNGKEAFNFDGADGQQGTEDEVVVIQGNDPVVLEQRVNQRGRLEWNQNTRYLAGIKIAGGGKGNIFTVTMLFSDDVPTDLDTVEHHFTADDTSTGLRVFFFQASSEAELMNHLRGANSRIGAFTTGYDDPAWRGVEMAGSNDGPEFMGMLVMWRGAASQ